MKIGIVGHAGDKFTPASEARARAIIRDLLTPVGSELVSGGCHLGAVDVWAEEEARALGIEQRIFRPATLSWAQGFKPRNLLIAQHSDVVHVIVVDRLPASYVGLRFSLCYHCGTRTHVKSGGCWTAKQAKMLGKEVHWHIIKQEEEG
jgi:hypothetical protein